jgi:signal transduction histidine kinase
VIDRIRAAAGSRPQSVDAGLAVLVAAVSIPAISDLGAGLTGWAWLAALCLPLAWRRRAPVVVLYAITTLAGAAFWAGAHGAYPLLVVMVAAYAVARHRPWRYLVPPLAAVEAALLGAVLQGELLWPGLAGLTCALAAAVLLGVTVQTRRAHLAALRERAERLELERDQQARLAAAAERARIAREVHDIVAHNLAVMVALSDGAAYTATLAPERAAHTMEQVSATGREALAEMRRLLGLLRDGGPPLTPAGSGDAADSAPQPGFGDLDRLLDRSRAAGLTVTLVREGVPGDWSPGAGQTVYRIVQEALTNTIKHAGARAAARVRLSFTATGAELEITDNGAARHGGDGGGHGLAGMSERVASHGGHFTAGPSAGRGWRVYAHLPFDRVNHGEAHDDPPASGRRPADASPGLPHGVRDPA